MPHATTHTEVHPCGPTVDSRHRLSPVRRVSYEGGDVRGQTRLRFSPPSVIPPREVTWYLPRRICLTVHSCTSSHLLCVCSVNHASDNTPAGTILRDEFPRNWGHTHKRNWWRSGDLVEDLSVLDTSLGVCTLPVAEKIVSEIFPMGCALSSPV